MNDFESDAVKLAGSYFAKPLGIIGIIIGVGLFGYCHGKAVASQDVQQKAIHDTIRITDSVFRQASASAEKATAVAKVAVKKSDASDRPVAITSDTTIAVVRHDTTIVSVVPPEVTKDLTDLRAAKVEQCHAIDSLTIALFGAGKTINARDKAIANPPRPSRWSLGVSGGYGPQMEHDHTVRLGWNAHLGINFRLF